MRKGDCTVAQHRILSSKLSLDSDIPLYTQLVGIIKHNIASGALRVGELLPSESELCRALDVSRNTVRQAIGELENEGLVVRKRGKGTFVADPNTTRRGVPYSFTTEISSMGKSPSSTLVDFTVMTPQHDICDMMGLRQGAKVYRFTRIRKVDGEPLILETSYYPQYIYPHLTRDMVETHSFYSLLYHVGIMPFSARESYEAVILDSRRAKLLGVAAGSCAFYHQRRTCTEDGRVYEYTCSYIRADRVRLDVHMQKSGMTFTRSID
ncbi:MAG: GntR family transcriptional regulator [Oscillospiraceae bacterium]|nr:GntR family transcriptional regulator [Oscillospiraceae bacterium]